MTKKSNAKVPAHPPSGCQPTCGVLDLLTPCVGTSCKFESERMRWAHSVGYPEWTTRLSLASAWASRWPLDA
eukprot:5401152-Prymnesium_polylepis.1